MSLIPGSQRSLGQKNLEKEKEMAIHSSIPAGKSPWTEELGGYIQSCPWDCKESDTTEHMYRRQIRGWATFLHHVKSTYNGL